MRSINALPRLLVLLVLSAIIVGAIVRPAHGRRPMPHHRPILATPEELEAERALLVLLADPDIKAIERKAKAQLAATSTGRSPDGAARLDHAVAEYTNSLILGEASAYQPSLGFVLFDDTPHSWYGLDVGGAGIAGDNPDDIYRRTTVDGAGRYEISGRIDLKHRPSEMTIEVMRGSVGPMQLKNQTKSHADMGNHVSITFDRDWTLGADGSFRLTFGGPGTGPNHLASEPGQVTPLIREALSDWNQRPAQVTIRRIDGVKPSSRDAADLKRRVVQKLADYIRFWGNYHTTWLGGLEPNAFNAPVSRDGGWGFVAGIHYKLAPDEALLVTTTTGGARYTGFQATDLWMIAPDSRRFQASLNLSQSTPNADGSYTYLISPTDPGIANWIDSAGVHEGYAVLRWQAVPKGVTGTRLVRTVRVIKLTDAVHLRGVARISPQQRKAQLAKNTAAYANRTRE